MEDMVNNDFQDKYKDHYNIDLQSGRLVAGGSKTFMNRTEINRSHRPCR